MRWKVAWEGETAVDVPATPAQVWSVLSDPTRVGEWSHECQAVVWCEGHSRAAVQAKFRGSNRSGSMRWSRTCTITEIEPTRLLVYRTSGGVPPDSTEWRFRLEVVGSGTRVTQSFRILKFPRLMELATVVFNPAHRDRSDALRGDLVRLGEIAQAAQPDKASLATTGQQVGVGRTRSDS
ncbi:MAG: hypothetical protein JWR85_962 [Marmoricola sp.]|nr:hypothetical protein [Marmoricola sp.]